MTSGLIFDIKRYAINDGPGIRLTFFFKGCPLSCVWCHNPESKSPHIQKMYSAKKCIGTTDCISVCSNDALTLTPEGIVTDPDVCQLCGKCAEACPTKAIEMSGELITAEEIARIIENETVFFDHSEGGVTFSGGEPLMHADFLIELLKDCGQKDIHRVVDTSGFAPTETLMEVAKHTDMFLYDLKVMDSKIHKQFTGVPNETILKNLEILANSGAEIIIRIPLVKGFNTDIDNIQKTADYIARLSGEKKKINLLPYHNIAETKYVKMGMFSKSKGLSEPSTEEIAHIQQIFENRGLVATVGG
ncbi:MAG: glycyl-radical enzyme activating protein [Candidatus Marinimicrobia bacterium]|nr:glycyl-radical enzyme activating protein [Candidatus Neomarinimicrobiota bacterium]